MPVTSVPGPRLVALARPRSPRARCSEPDVQSRGIRRQGARWPTRGALLAGAGSGSGALLTVDPAGLVAPVESNPTGPIRPAVGSVTEVGDIMRG
jgi:hypothetical protein